MTMCVYMSAAAGTTSYAHLVDADWAFHVRDAASG